MGPRPAPAALLAGSLAAACRPDASTAPAAPAFDLPQPRLGRVAWVPPRLAGIDDGLALAAARGGESPQMVRIEPRTPAVVEVGRCTPLLAEIGRLQEHLVATLDPVLADRARALSDRFARTLPADLGNRVATACPGAAKVLEGCVPGAPTPCPVAPRLVVADRVVVAVPDAATAGVILECPDPEVVQPLVAHGLETAAAEVRTWPARPWFEVAARLASLVSLSAAVEDLCVPRRRRFPPEVLASARARLSAMDGVLGAPVVAADLGRFVPGSGRVHVAGTGGFAVAVALRPGPTSAARSMAAETSAFLAVLRDGAACATDRRRTSWGAKAPDGRVVAVYPESFVCGALGPDRRVAKRARRRRPTKSAAVE